MAPQSVARGAPRSGDRAAAGMPERAKVYMGRQQPATGSHLPLEETAPPCAVSPDFTAALMGRGFTSGLPCQAPGEGAPRSVARGAPQSGDRAAEGMLRPHHSFVGAQASRCGVASSFRKTLLRPARSHHSRRRLSRIPSCKATVAPAEIHSALP